MNIPEPLLNEFCCFVEKHTGLRLQAQRSMEWSRGMFALARELHCADIPSCLRAIMESRPSPEMAGMLARHFTIGETYFFRDPAVFNALEYDVLPRLIHARRDGSKHLRIWSAGCCSGEEPYSLAILLNRLIPDIEQWRITLLATDINPAFLDKARQGVYRQWSFRDAPASIKLSHFETIAPDSYALSERIRRLVTFGYLNLAEDRYPDTASNTIGMDIILCRNVLMYFGATRAADVVERLHRALVPGGLLVVSPAERGRELFPQFEEVHYPGTAFYRKGLAEVFVPEVRPDPDTTGTKDAMAAIAEITGEIENGITGEDGITGILRDESAVAEDENPHQSAALLARSHANLGRLDEALHCCEAAIAADKAEPNLRYLRAMIFQEQNRHDAAMQSLKQALFLDQGFVLAHFALGSLCRRNGKLAESERHFANAAALLGKFAPGDTLPESEGMTAARLSEIIRAAEAAS